MEESLKTLEIAGFQFLRSDSRKKSEICYFFFDLTNQCRYDIILDANGVSTLQQSYNHLCPGGKLVVYGFHSMLPKEVRKTKKKTEKRINFMTELQAEKSHLKIVLKKRVLFGSP